MTGFGSRTPERPLGARAAGAILAWALALPLAAEEIVLPAPASATGARAASITVEASPRPDGAFDARVSMALVGGPAGERVALSLPPLPVSSAEVAGATVPPPAGGRLEFDIQAQEALAIAVIFRVEPDLLDWLPAAEAAWLGRTRGPLLQPAQRLVIRHPEGSAFADSPVSARIMTGRELPVSALLQAPPGRLEQGMAAWEGRVVRPPERLALAWPLLPDALVPRDRPEAEALAEDLLQRDVPGIEFDRVRELVASSGEPGARAAADVLASLASERNRQREMAERERRRRAEEDARQAALREAAAREAQAQADREAAARAATSPRPAATPAYRESLERAAEENVERERREQLARAMLPMVSGIPWIRSADAARRFLGELESSGGDARTRVEEAIALMRARWGEPFRYERRWRERFENEPWYAPRREDALLPPTEGEVAALEILSAALR